MKPKRKTRTTMLITGAAAALLLTACPGDIELTGSQNIRVAGETIESEVYESGARRVASISGPSFEVAQQAFETRDFPMQSDDKVLVFLASNDDGTPVAVGTPGNDSFTFIVTPGDAAELVEADQLWSVGGDVESDDPEARFDELRLYVGEQEFDSRRPWDLRYGAIIDGGNRFVSVRYIYADRGTVISGGNLDGVQLAAGWNVFYVTYQGWFGNVSSVDVGPPAGASFDWVVYSPPLR